MRRGFWWENLKGKDSLKDLGVDGRKIKQLLLTQNNAWNEFIWLKMGKSSGMFCLWQ
jgi:hypothetical protein